MRWKCVTIIAYVLPVIYGKGSSNAVQTYRVIMSINTYRVIMSINTGLSSAERYGLGSIHSNEQWCHTVDSKSHHNNKPCVKEVVNVHPTEELDLE
jgi:hypothetical protein